MTDTAAWQMGVVPERTAGAAVSAGSAEMPEAECGRLIGTGVWWNCCEGSLSGTWRPERVQGRRCSWPVASTMKEPWTAAPRYICMESTVKSSDTMWHYTMCVCSVIKQFSHGLGDAHVALGRLWGDTASGNQRLHWLVEKHAAGNKICYWKNSIRAMKNSPSTSSQQEKQEQKHKPSSILYEKPKNVFM